MSIPITITLIGATGGADTTQLSLGLTAAFAIDGRDVTVLGVAFVTQSLSDYVSETLNSDAMALITDAVDVPPELELVAFEIDAKGCVTIYPATAPFGRLARVMTSDAARAFESRTTGIADGFGYVPVDAPSPALNRTIAATATCSRTALVTPTTNRDADTIGRLSTRVTDIDTGIDAVVSTFGALNDTDVAMPETEATGLAGASACHEDAELTAGVVTVAGVLLDIGVDAVATTDGILGSISEYVRR